MSFKSYLSKLNSQAKNSQLSLLAYENAFSIVKKCSSLIVGGRVLLVCSNKKQERFTELDRALVKKGFKVSVIEFSGSANNLDDLSKLFACPEDVRLVITIENSLALATSYFASVNGIPSIVLVSDIFVKPIFVKKLIVNTSNGLDEVIFNDKRFVFIDESIIDSPKAQSFAFADIQTKALSLLEYRLRDKALQTGLDLVCYSQIRKAILETFPIFAHSKKTQKELLLYSLFRVYVADYIASGKVFFGQTSNIASMLLGSENGLDKLKVQKFTLSLLEALFSGKHENILDCPDYLFRTKYLLSKYNEDERFFYNQFLQTSNIAKKLNKNDFVALQKEVSALLRSCDRMINIYLALGGAQGSENGQIAKAIKYAGDFPYCINSATFLRESGILEYL